MAEVTLTLVDPVVYGDVAEPEIEIHDDLPEDWDECRIRAARQKKRIATSRKCVLARATKTKPRRAPAELETQRR